MSIIVTFSAFLIIPLRKLWLVVAARASPDSLFSRETTHTIKKSTIESKVGTDCPYEYILNVYGRNHFAGIVNILDSKLLEADPVKHQIIMEAMDAVHFAAILVDDVADNSPLRKGKPAAHTIYGASETINRAYTRLFETMQRAAVACPALLPILTRNLTEIHQGQDISLVWRRDGSSSLPADRDACIAAYRNCASLKTGALFRLVGQLVTEDNSKDDLMTRVGWYCHLQNDCKNVYSSDYTSAKGALAEDIKNGEFSFPVILALYSAHGRSAIENAFASGGAKGQARALDAIRHDSVRLTCLKELEGVGKTIPEFVALWGRKEKMNATAQKGPLHATMK
ncbi:prenyl transferase [Geopyxis carbonaria]|nr:prenyl transferase [Geopyxis carbonaria]